MSMLCLALNLHPLARFQFKSFSVAVNVNAAGKILNKTKLPQGLVKSENSANTNWKFFVGFGWRKGNDLGRVCDDIGIVTDRGGDFGRKEMIVGNEKKAGSQQRTPKTAIYVPFRNLWNPDSNLSATCIEMNGM